MRIELSAEPRASTSPADVNEPAGRLLKLLGDPTRRRIFAALMAGDTCNCELVQSLGIAENLVSHHIKQLRLAGFVHERRDSRDARWVHYGLDRAALSEAWASLGAFLNPARLGSREPMCPAPGEAPGTVATGCPTSACRRPFPEGGDVT
ncbi:MAG: winged helix-turn-helix transcriptional regulator [Chloroflexi bacterium]|nr:winged helix-turn-helix transcriptional regulator [Chloroflexota bacterium]